ncbi:MAG: hypothetical protein ABEJ99_02180 [Candidatus Nanohaloarchaea archaeon]
MTPELKTRLGHCIICGRRVYSDESHLKTADGYCHRNCLADSAVFA